MNSPYDIGDVAKLRVSFTNSAGTKVDPSSVTLQIRHTRSDVLSYRTLVYGVDSIAKAGTGDYEHDFAITSENAASLVGSGESLGGKWRQRWNGTGNNVAAAEKAFDVNHRIVGA